AGLLNPVAPRRGERGPGVGAYAMTEAGAADPLTPTLAPEDGGEGVENAPEETAPAAPTHRSDHSVTPSDPACRVKLGRIRTLTCEDARGSVASAAGAGAGSVGAGAAAGAGRNEPNGSQSVTSSRLMSDSRRADASASTCRSSFNAR